jgi:uncharacterized membrane protein
MAARSLFHIVIKILGLLFIKDIVMTIPSFMPVIYGFGYGNMPGAFSMLLITALTLLIYLVIAFYFIFNTDWVISKLRLIENFPEDPIPLNIHRSTVVSIALLLLALFLIVQAIPLLVSELTKWYRYNDMLKGIPGQMDAFDYSMILVYLAQIVIGLLLIGYHRPLVGYIEMKTRASNIREY